MNRQTDILRQHNPRYAYASGGKNVSVFATVKCRSISNPEKSMEGWTVADQPVRVAISSDSSCLLPRDAMQVRYRKSPRADISENREHQRSVHAGDRRHVACVVKTCTHQVAQMIHCLRYAAAATTVETCESEISVRIKSLIESADSRFRLQLQC